jgi:hypothetical protein
MPEITDPTLIAATERVDNRADLIGEVNDTLTREQAMLVFAGMDVDAVQLQELLFLSSIGALSYIADSLASGESDGQVILNTIVGVTVKAFALGWEVRDGQS